MAIAVSAGATLKLARTLTGVPAGEALTKAYLTVKTDPQDPDPGVIQKTITAVLDASGQITDTGAGDTQAAVLFIVTNVDTSLLVEGTLYYWDIKAITAGGNYPTARDTFTVTRGVTGATT
ncbi:MAG TPA: hypothetical protein VNM48_00515 [Chloroflexota bacterium]|nr:hypothetical protein [Chloroflexota bacterium]